jgi:hypothetical protein
MRTGPTQAEAVRLRTADGIKRAEAARRAAPLAGARRAQQRARVLAAFEVALAALRLRARRQPAPESYAATRVPLQ